MIGASFSAGVCKRHGRSSANRQSTRSRFANVDHISRSNSGALIGVGAGLWEVFCQDVRGGTRNQHLISHAADFPPAGEEASAPTPPHESRSRGRGSALLKHMQIRRSPEHHCLNSQRSIVDEVRPIDLVLSSTRWLLATSCTCPRCHTLLCSLSAWRHTP